MAATTPKTAHRSSALLSHLARLIRMASEHELEPLGLRPRHLIALTVMRENGGLTGQQELATELGVDRTNLVGLLNELEGEGLILRRRAPQDRRRHIVELRPAGEQRLCAAETAIGAAEDEVLGALSDHQREQLFELLQQASAGRAPDCAAAAAEREPEC
ncbi:MAG TPA: MarR family transcriptional regulator [Solirubrobacterales bacterium]|jgi:DNA-binding MarR family transcriptional regulator|nr:MarR family transcriptional regulator [Solirubrobacterales bacterium]